MHVHHSVHVKVSSKLLSQYKSISVLLLFTMWISKLRMKRNIPFSIFLWFCVLPVTKKKKVVKKIKIRKRKKRKIFKNMLNQRLRYMVRMWFGNNENEKNCKDRKRQNLKRHANRNQNTCTKKRSTDFICILKKELLLKNETKV